jgi:SM-20-related protein
LENVPILLAERGWVVWEGLVPPAAVEALGREVRELHAAGRFRPAGIGRGEQHRVQSEIRGDSLLWLDPAAPTPAQAPLFAAVDRLSRLLNRELFTGIEDAELQYAVYPPGARYRRHVDQFQAGRRRVVTVLLYLNPDWTETDGGALRIHEAHEGRPFVDVPPRAGVVVTFLSERVAHEVLPARRERYAVGGWLRRRA